MSMDWYTERLVVKASSTRTRPESVMPNLIALRSSGSGLRWTSPCRSSRSSVGHNQVMASSLFLLALGEAVIHTQGPGGAAAFAAATYAYFPALILAALSGWGPGWARLTAGASGVAFGIHAFAHGGGADVTLDGPIAGAGYALLSLTLIGWTGTCSRHRATELKT